MHRLTRIHRSLFLSLALPCIAAAWWGCAAGDDGTNSTGPSTSGKGGSDGAGGTDIHVDGGDGGKGAASCTATSAEAHPTPLDMVFVIDESASLVGAEWAGISTALITFFNDTASAGISAGLLFFPNKDEEDICDYKDYLLLGVPIGLLPDNAVALTNSIPDQPGGHGSPVFGALKGSLMAYAVAVAGGDLDGLNKVAAAGGTTAAYDVTQDVSLFSQKMTEIRRAALDCDFQIPDPPNGKALDPGKVNFTYTPGGAGEPVTLPRADGLADCEDEPGWYYDNNLAPTKMILCPASCATVRNDANAKVSVEFGCQTLVK
jgi:hypothetical protein